MDYTALRPTDQETITVEKEAAKYFFLIQKCYKIRAKNINLVVEA